MAGGVINTQAIPFQFSDLARFGFDPSRAIISPSVRFGCHVARRDQAGRTSAGRIGAAGYGEEIGK